MIKSPIVNPIMWKQKYLLSGIVVTLGAFSLIISNIDDDSEYAHKGSPNRLIWENYGEVHQELWKS